MLAESFRMHSEQAPPKLTSCLDLERAMQKSKSRVMSSARCADRFSNRTRGNEISKLTKVPIYRGGWIPVDSTIATVALRL